jgi:hypothetical protein
MHAHV